MPLRNAIPLKLTPLGVTDTVDGTNGIAGSMRSTRDLIPSMHTRGMWVPRPATIPYVDFGRPVTGELIEVIGSKVYGFVTSQNHLGHSEPFVYDTQTQQFLPIQGMHGRYLPLSAPETGDWTPPTMTQVGAYLLFTHPGFSLPNAFGWLDTTGFGDQATGGVGFPAPASVYGTAIFGTSKFTGASDAGGTLVGNFQPYPAPPAPPKSTTPPKPPPFVSKNVILAGWRPGLLISDSKGFIPTGTRIASISEDGLTLTLDQATTGGVASGDVLTVTGGTPESPLWAAGNMAVHPLVDVPKAVANFNGRAYYAVQAGIEASDPLNPLISSWATAPQVLTFDNGLDVTAFVTLPLATTLGAVAQNLLCFQGDGAIQSITGDPDFGTWSKSLLSSIGTLAPNTIVSSPAGAAYIAPDGLRIINQSGVVGDPLGANGDGVALPFINAIYPSRMCAAYNEDIIRVSTTYNKDVDGAVIAEVESAEFWYHLKLKVWSGPHLFPAAVISPLNLSPPRHGYLMFPTLANGIWFSESRPSISSSYIENGVPLNWIYHMSLFPDTGTMFMNAMNETTVGISLPTGQALDVSFANEGGDTLDHIQIFGDAPVPFVLGTAVLGLARLGAGPPAPSGRLGIFVLGQSALGDPGAGARFKQRLLPWDRELVFKQGRMIISGPSRGDIAIGNVYGRYQITGWTVEDYPISPMPPPSPPAVMVEVPGPEGPPGPNLPGGYTYYTDANNSLYIRAPDGTLIPLVINTP